MFIPVNLVVPFVSLTLGWTVSTYSLYHLRYRKPDEEVIPPSPIGFTLFTLFSTLLNTSANLVLILKAFPIGVGLVGFAAPLAAGLFVAAACFDLFKELHNYYKTLEYQKTPAPEKNEVFLNYMNTAIRSNLGQKYRNAATINLAASTLLIGLMIVWGFVPVVGWAAMILSASCVLGLGLIYVGKTYLLKKNNQRFERKINEELITLVNGEFLKRAVSASIKEQSASIKEQKVKALDDLKVEVHAYMPPNMAGLEAVVNTWVDTKREEVVAERVVDKAPEQERKADPVIAELKGVLSKKKRTKSLPNLANIGFYESKAPGDRPQDQNQPKMGFFKSEAASDQPKEPAKAQSKTRRNSI